MLMTNNKNYGYLTGILIETIWFILLGLSGFLFEINNITLLVLSFLFLVHSLIFINLTFKYYEIVNYMTYKQGEKLLCFDFLVFLIVLIMMFSCMVMFFYNNALLFIISVFHFVYYFFLSIFMSYHREIKKKLRCLNC